MVAGVQLAVSQPFRIGDRISFEETSRAGSPTSPSPTPTSTPATAAAVVIPNQLLVEGDRPQPLDRRHAGLSGRPRARSTLCSMAQRTSATSAAARGDRRQARCSSSAPSSSLLAIAGDRGHLLGARRRRRRALARHLQADRPRRQLRPSTPPTAASSALIASDEARAPVSIERIPKQLQLATVAIEDQRFYEHGGIDPEGIARAALKNLEAGEAVEGGSTITQQLVRNLCIRNPERDARAQDRRGEAGDRVRRAPLAHGDPRPVPQHRLLRDGRRRDRGRRRRRRARSTSPSRSGS